MIKSSLKTGLLLAVAAIVSGGWLSTALAAGNDSSVQVQQNQTCSGVVVDEEGLPVIGAAVLIKGTLKGTSTDVNGRFTLPQAKPGDVLEVSSVGYLPTEIVWNGSPLNIILNEDKLSIEESVVVGYGVQKKVNVTGAVSMVDSDVFESRPVQTVSQALQGQIPGRTHAPVLLVHHPDTAVLGGIRIANRPAAILAPIIDQQDLEIGEALGKDAVHTSRKISLRVVDGDDDGQFSGHAHS